MLDPDSMSDVMPFSSSSHCEDRQFYEKLDPENNKFTCNQVLALRKLNEPNTHNCEINKALLPSNDCSTVSKLISSNCGISRHADLKSSGTWPFDSKGEYLVAKERCTQDITDKSDLCLQSLKCHLVSRSSDTMGEEDEMNVKVDLNGIREHSHPSISSMTDTSGVCASSCPTYKNSNSKAFLTVKGAGYIVKATYKADAVRFKLSPSMGCSQLYEEIGKRFQLSTGTFQLKYMDDEEEWVMLTIDSDLHECIEVLDSVSSRCMKL